MEINEDAWDLWNAVRTQWRASGIGYIGIVDEEVRKHAERLEIELDDCTWSKIRALESDFLKQQSETAAEGAGNGDAEDKRSGSKKPRKNHKDRR